MKSLSPHLLDVNDTSGHLVEGRSEWQQYGAGSPARSAFYQKVEVLLLHLLSMLCCCLSCALGFAGAVCELSL